MIIKTTDKFNFILTITDDLISQGFHAGHLVKEVARVTEGGGGGRPHMATAGGKNQDKLGDAIAQLKNLILENQR
jgi:alanyl-tRNA synthetase